MRIVNRDHNKTKELYADFITTRLPIRMALVFHRSVGGITCTSLEQVESSLPYYRKMLSEVSSNRKRICRPSRAYNCGLSTSRPT